MSKVDSLTQLLDFFKANTSQIVADYIQIAGAGNFDTNPKLAATNLVALTTALLQLEAKMLELNLIVPIEDPYCIKRLTKYCLQQVQEVPWKTTTRATTASQVPGTGSWTETEKTLSGIQDFFTSLEIILKILN